MNEEQKQKHILNQEIGKLGKKGLQRVISIEKILKALIKEYKRMDDEIKLLRSCERESP